MTPHVILPSKDLPNVRAGKLGCLTVEMPQEPHAPNLWGGYHQEDHDHYAQAKKDYHAALESAMSSAVEVENAQEIDFDKYTWQHSKDTIYPLSGYRVEFKDVIYENVVSEFAGKVAIITPISEEPQRNERLDVIRERTTQQTKDRVDEQFTDLQKTFAEAMDMTHTEITDLIVELRHLTFNLQQMQHSAFEYRKIAQEALKSVTRKSHE